MKRKQIETVASRGSEDRMRERVLGAAFSAFQEFGYAGASTIEIATRARTGLAIESLFWPMLTKDVAEIVKRWVRNSFVIG